MGISVVVEIVVDVVGKCVFRLAIVVPMLVVDLDRTAFDVAVR